MYQTFDIFDAKGDLRCTLAAESPEQAVFRAVGGAWGRTDWRAVKRGLPFDPRPSYATTWPARRA